MSDQKTYRVLWAIDLAANSPIEAARQALRIQRDLESIATVFDLTDDGGITERIDLDDAAGVSTLSLSRSDWVELYYAVELKRLHVAKDNRENRPYSDDGVDLDAWRRQMEHIASALGPDGERMHRALTDLLESADRVISRWGQTDLQFAVQDLDAALGPFGFGTRRGKAKRIGRANPRRQIRGRRS